MMHCRRLATCLLAAFLACLAPAPRADVVLNELMYHPLSDLSDDEFLELHNTGAAAMDLSGWTMADGITWTFPAETTLAPGEFLVLSPNLAQFAATYGDGIRVLGPYTGKLDNAGERVALADAGGVVRDEVTYDDGTTWPTTPDGGGPSLELRSPALDNALPASWQASALTGGTPGRENGEGREEPPFVDVFARIEVLEFEIEFSQADWWDQLEANADAEVYIEARFLFDGHAYPGVGVRFKGNSSQNAPGIKKPFKVDFNEFQAGQRFMGMDNVNLGNSFKDPTFMREAITADVARELGLPAPRYAWANLAINGQPWGLYVVQEQVDETFLDRVFGEHTGNLYKGDPRGLLQYRGADPASYATDYELKTNEDINDWSDLIALCEALDVSTPGAFLGAVSPRLDVGAALGHLALDNVFANFDSYIGSGHNYYLYHATADDRFVPILWDMNESFGVFTLGMSTTQIVNYGAFAGTRTGPNRKPMLRLSAAEGDVAAYRAWMEDILRGPFREAGIAGRIATMHALLAPHVAADPNKFFTYEQYLANQHEDVAVAQPGVSTIMGLTRFVRDRRAALMAELGLADGAAHGAAVR